MQQGTTLNAPPLNKPTLNPAAGISFPNTFSATIPVHSAILPVAVPISPTKPAHSTTTTSPLSGSLFHPTTPKTYPPPSNKVKARPSNGVKVPATSHHGTTANATASRIQYPAPFTTPVKVPPNLQLKKTPTHTTTPLLSPAKPALTLPPSTNTNINHVLSSFVPPSPPQPARFTSTPPLSPASSSNLIFQSYSQPTLSPSIPAQTQYTFNSVPPLQHSPSSHPLLRTSYSAVMPPTPSLSINTSPLAKSVPSLSVTEPPKKTHIVSGLVSDLRKQVKNNKRKPDDSNNPKPARVRKKVAKTAVTPLTTTEEQTLLARLQMLGSELSPAVNRLKRKLTLREVARRNGQEPFDIDTRVTRMIESTTKPQQRISNYFSKEEISNFAAQTKKVQSTTTQSTNSQSATNPPTLSTQSTHPSSSFVHPPVATSAQYLHPSYHPSSLSSPLLVQPTLQPHTKMPSAIDMFTTNSVPPNISLTTPISTLISTTPISTTTIPTTPIPTIPISSSLASSSPIPTPFFAIPSSATPVSTPLSTISTSISSTAYATPALSPSIPLTVTSTTSIDTFSTHSTPSMPSVLAPPPVNDAPSSTTLISTTNTSSTPTTPAVASIPSSTSTTTSTTMTSITATTTISDDIRSDVSKPAENNISSITLDKQPLQGDVACIVTNSNSTNNINNVNNNTNNIHAQQLKLQSMAQLKAVKNLPHSVQEAPRTFRSLLEGDDLREGLGQSLVSPYTLRTLKPKPRHLRLMEELMAHPRVVRARRACQEPDKESGDPNMAGEDPAEFPIDYVYFRPWLLPQVNTFLCSYFWPGIDVRECLEYPDFTVCAVYRNMLVGCGFMTPDAYVIYIAVRNGWRDAGIATFMLYHLSQTIQGKDITLHVSATNPAMLLYQKFGFKPEEFIVDFYNKYYPDDSLECKHAYLLRLRR